MTQRKKSLSKKIGDRIKVHGSQGTIKFLGETQFAPGLWIGIEFDKQAGNNDGQINRVKYFDCKSGHGLFIRFKNSDKQNSSQKNEEEEETEEEKEEEEEKEKQKEKEKQIEKEKQKEIEIEKEKQKVIDTKKDQTEEKKTNNTNEVVNTKTDQDNERFEEVSIDTKSIHLKGQRSSSINVLSRTRVKQYNSAPKINIKTKNDPNGSDDKKILLSPKIKQKQIVKIPNNKKFGKKNKKKSKKKKRLKLLTQIAEKKSLLEDCNIEIKTLEIGLEKKVLDLKKQGTSGERIIRRKLRAKELEKTRAKLEKLAKQVKKKSIRNKSSKRTLETLNDEFICQNEEEIKKKFEEICQAQIQINIDTETEFELGNELENEKKQIQEKLSQIVNKLQNEKDEQTLIFQKRSQKIQQIEEEKKQILKNISLTQGGYHNNFFDLQDQINELNQDIMLGHKKIRELEKSRKIRMNKQTEIVQGNQNNKSQWIAKLMNNRPEILELREKLRPVYQNQPFGRLKTTEKVLHRNCITSEDILQLIMQHYELQGKTKIRRFIEKDTGIKYNYEPQTESMLINLLKIGCKEDNPLWDLTQQQEDGEVGALEVNQDEELNVGRNIVLSLDIDDVNIWDEPADNEKNFQIQPNFEKDYQNNDLLNTIHLANVNKLIENLIHPKYNDQKFNQAFLMTYHSFLKPEHLLLKIQQRYRVPPMKENEDENEYRKLKNDIQKNTINILEYWVNHHFSDFNPILIESIKSFFENETIKDFKKESQVFLSNLSTIEENKNPKKIISKSVSSKNSIPPPETIIPKTLFTDNFELTDVHSIELARQMTLFFHNLYKKIQPSELVEQSWNKKKERHKAPNVMRMINKFNEFSKYVIESIVSQTSVKKRANEFFRWIKVAKELHDIQNFESLMLVLAGLSNSCCKRLKATKNEMSKNSLSLMDQLKETVSSNKGFKKYRDLLSKIKLPAIPYLGVFLTDLTYISDGSPSKMEGLINFSKCKLLYNVIREITKYQKVNFNFSEIYQIQEIFKQELTNKNEKELYEISLKNEPRSTSRSNVN
ncbi:guanine nucleotide exchange factor [Anaeramoeba flamelloides]|uniref:Guanine nucleotide exchange factor n=1 Tax=Anaeramoeba flamelloides TaxID=1746091 RepID=A0ABQ8YNG7_9EUKA|nr:guanine nucleotide exchange factor [Anaeramoeba flamelloides]